MIIYLGENTVVKDRDIIGMFDMDTATIGAASRAYLTMAQKAGQIEASPGVLPRSFVVASRKCRQQTVYLSPVSTATLNRRTEKSFNQSLLQKP